MNPILYLVVAVAVISLLSPVMRMLIAAVGGKQIGAAALAKQPDTIHLELRDPSIWKNSSAAGRLSQPLLARGFEDAGVYSVKELPGLTVHLLAHPGDNFYAAVYEHPVAGQWLDVFSRFPDDSSFTVTTAKPTGLTPRPGHVSLNVPGLAPGQVLDKAIAERPRNQWPNTVSTEKAVAVFEKAYASSMTYRKQAGISRGEVVKVAMKRAA